MAIACWTAPTLIFRISAIWRAVQPEESAWNKASREAVLVPSRRASAVLPASARWRKVRFIEHGRAPFSDQLDRPSSERAIMGKVTPLTDELSRTKYEHSESYRYAKELVCFWRPTDYGDGWTAPGPVGENQAELMRRRTRELLAGQDTSLLNALPRYMAETGVVAPQGGADKTRRGSVTRAGRAREL